MKKIYILLTIILITTVCLIIKINNKEENKNNLTAQETEITKNEENTLKIIENKYNYGKIEVIIKNNTGKEIKESTIQAECYDKQGNNLGTFSNKQQNINTKDKYKINIYVNWDTATYKLSVKYK